MWSQRVNKSFYLRCFKQATVDIISRVIPLRQADALWGADPTWSMMARLVARSIARLPSSRLRNKRTFAKGVTNCKLSRCSWPNVAKRFAEENRSNCQDSDVLNFLFDEMLMLLRPSWVQTRTVHQLQLNLRGSGGQRQPGGKKSQPRAWQIHLRFYAVPAEIGSPHFRHGLYEILSIID